MSSSETSASAYGVSSMQVPAPPPGSNGSLQQNNTAITNQNTQRQMAARFGGSKGGAVVVPPVQISYKEGGVGNTNTSSNITNSTKTQADLFAAKEYDNQVGPVQPVQKAGRRRKLTKSRSRKLTGGWPAWGCMSGGKKSRRRKTHRRKTHRRKSHRRRKSK